jgi:hypothetical protein
MVTSASRRSSPLERAIFAFILFYFFFEFSRHIVAPLSQRNEMGDVQISPMARPTSLFILCLLLLRWQSARSAGWIHAASFGLGTVYETPGSSTYIIPSNTLYLLVFLVGGGGGGGAGDANAGGGAGGGGAYRIFTIVVDGFANCTVNVGQGGPGGVTIGASGTAGTQTTIVCNGETLYASAGGAGAGASGATSGGGGGSGGAANGGSASGITAGAAGSSTSPVTTFAISVPGNAGAAGRSTAGAGANGNSLSALTTDLYVVGGSGAAGGSTQTRNGGLGGPCQGGQFVGGAAGTGVNASYVGGGGAGASGLADGGAGGGITGSAGNGSRGSGGGGGAGITWGRGGNGGNGYVVIVAVSKL